MESTSQVDSISFRTDTDRSLGATGQCIMVIENCPLKDRAKAKQLLKDLLNENL